MSGKSTSDDALPISVFERIFRSYNATGFLPILLTVLLVAFALFIPNFGERHRGWRQRLHRRQTAVASSPLRPTRPAPPSPSTCSTTTCSSCRRRSRSCSTARPMDAGGANDGARHHRQHRRRQHRRQRHADGCDFRRHAQPGARGHQCHHHLYGEPDQRDRPRRHRRLSPGERHRGGGSDFTEGSGGHHLSANQTSANITVKCSTTTSRVRRRPSRSRSTRATYDPGGANTALPIRRTGTATATSPTTTRRRLRLPTARPTRPSRAPMPPSPLR